MQLGRHARQNICMQSAFRNKRVTFAFHLGAVLGLLIGVWLARPTDVSDATLPHRVASHSTPLHLTAESVRAAARRAVPAAPDLRQALARVAYGRRLEQQRRQLIVEHRIAALNAVHSDLALHAVGSQLYTAWNAPMTLKAMNWYGFEYAPFVPDGLDQAPLDAILSTVHDLGFNALRITFANETVESNPIIEAGLGANPELRGLHSLDIMERIIKRAHHFGIRVILCNTRSEAGRGPELKSGLWYTDQYPQSAWASDWLELTRRFQHDSSFVGADLRNEPHIVGGSLDHTSVLNNGPLWGAFQGTYYRARDWRYAAQTLGNELLDVNPHLLIIVEGVQLYLDPVKGVMTGGLWGSNLIGAQYDPVVLSHPSQLVYSVHEYGPHMWQGDWFNPKTTYQSLVKRWTDLWGYLLNARKILRAPIFVGEFGTCHEYYACIGSNQGWKQGFWFQSFVKFLAAHPQVGWAYWALNPTGPFRTQDDDFYSLVTRDWRHYYPMITYGLAPLLREPGGLWTSYLKQTGTAVRTDFAPEPGCMPGKSCTTAALKRLGVIASASGKSAPVVPISPPDNTVFAVQMQSNVSYIQPGDGIRRGDLYLPQHQMAERRPAVLILHGGTWADGTKGQAGTVALARGFAERGYVAFDINFRLAGQGGNFPSDVQDVKDAVGFLAANQARYRIDVRRLAVVGAGAGGHLALLAGYTPSTGQFASPHYGDVPARIGAVASFFGPSNLAHLVQHSPDPTEASAVSSYLGAPYASNAKLYDRASPVNYIPTAVSTILFHGVADHSVPIWQPFDLYRLLRQDKAPSKFVDLPGAPHGLMDLTPQQLQAAVTQTVTFFNTVFYKPSPAQQG
jgi:acetyl esterase/lipase/aryl-phospho-beta-D-glucosidase BglC (GH1 family)